MIKILTKINQKSTKRRQEIGLESTGAGLEANVADLSNQRHLKSDL